MGTVGLKNKVAVVTGANHGMGAATAIALAREGAKVLVNYYRFAAEAYGELTDEDVAAATTPGQHECIDWSTLSHT